MIRVERLEFVESRDVRQSRLLTRGHHGALTTVDFDEVGDDLEMTARRFRTIGVVEDPIVERFTRHARSVHGHARHSRGDRSHAVTHGCQSRSAIRFDVFDVSIGNDESKWQRGHESRVTEFTDLTE